MITEKQKCIAEQAVYGDLMLNRRAYDDVEEKYIIEQVDSKWVLDFINFDKLLSLTPILRPLSDLTKEITHKGYNDNKPFIPLLELVKIAQGVKATDHLKLLDDMVIDFTIAYHFKQNVLWFQSLQGEKQVYILPNQNKFFDLLHLLHFDTRGLIEQSEAVDVNTLAQNPYEV